MNDDSVESKYAYKLDKSKLLDGNEPSNLKDVLNIKIPEFQKLIYVQNQFVNLRDETSKELIDYVTKNFVSNSVIFEVSSLLCAIASRIFSSNNRSLYVNFLNALCMNASFHAHLLRCAHPYFILKFYEAGLISIEELKERAKVGTNRFFFGHIFKYTKEQLYDQDFSFVTRQYDDLVANDWAGYKDVVEFGWPLDSIMRYIKKDDCGKFISYIKTNQIDLKDPLDVNWCRFETKAFIDLKLKKVTFLEAAIIFKAKSIYGILMSQGFTVTPECVYACVIANDIDKFKTMLEKFPDQRKEILSFALKFASYFFNDSMYDYISSLLEDEHDTMFNLKCNNYITSIYSLYHHPVSEAILVCSEMGYISLIEVLRSKIKKKNIKNNNSNNPFFVACLYGHKDICVKLREYMPFLRLDDKNDSGDTPLHLAVKSRNVDLINYLIREGANLEIMNCSDYTPLKIACESGYNEIIDIFMLRGVSVNFTYTLRKKTLLHYACENGLYNYIMYCLGHGIDVNARDIARSTPLILATKSNNTEIVKCLLENGADPNVYDTESRPPLMTAVLNDNKEIIDLLISYGANPKAKSDLGYIYKKAKSPELRQYLEGVANSFAS